MFNAAQLNPFTRGPNVATKPDQPASPDRGALGREATTGITAREHAAILLRSPTSGTPWLDEMILDSRRRDLIERFATEMAAFEIFDNDEYDGVASDAVEYADRLLKAIADVKDAEKRAGAR